MRATLLGIVLLALAAPAAAGDLVYEGTWITTNRPIDGPMTCVVSDMGENKWRGHFYGVWQGIAYSYHVEFSGPPDKLRGTASIDGADYEWVGKMDRKAGGVFKGEFWGNRYNGNFSLKQKNK